MLLTLRDLFDRVGEDEPELAFLRLSEAADVLEGDRKRLEVIHAEGFHAGSVLRNDRPRLSRVATPRPGIDRA